MAKVKDIGVWGFEVVRVLVLWCALMSEKDWKL